MFSRSGFRWASRLRSSLVQMMKAFRGLLTLCCVEEADLATGLVQLESEFTDAGLDGPEAGERTSLLCSPSAEAESSLWNAFAQCWYAAGSWRKRMVKLGWCWSESAPGNCHPHSDEEWPIYAGAPPMGAREEWIKGVNSRCFSRVGGRPIWRHNQQPHETSDENNYQSVHK